MLCGALGGVAYWTACYPFDVAKTLIQTQPAPTPSLHASNGNAALEPVAYRTTIQTLRRVVADEGVRGLYRGYLPSVLRSIPAASCTFLTFEFVTKCLAPL